MKEDIKAYTVEDIRKMDTEITGSFLKDNKLIVQAIMEKFENRWRESKLNEDGFFYLKGGNAFYMLKAFDHIYKENGNVTDDNIKMYNKENEYNGDYDFQYLINDPTDLGEIDREIKQVLENTISDAIDELREEVIKVNAFHSCEQSNPQLKFAGKQAEEDEIKQQTMEDMVKPTAEEIGAKYKRYKYGDIVKLRTCLKDNGMYRLYLQENERDQADTGKRNEGFRIYVNNTIPGFILYRMVYFRRYNNIRESVTIKNGKIEPGVQTGFMLKSEIIDISIPREGSAECWMSTEGNVTNFLDIKGYEYKIPGWGYHLYENINMLQEIDLGISGSVHKAEKRKERGAYALKQICIANNDKVFGCRRDNNDTVEINEYSADFINQDTIKTNKIKIKSFTDIILNYLNGYENIPEGLQSVIKINVCNFIKERLETTRILEQKDKNDKGYYQSKLDRMVNFPEKSLGFIDLGYGQKNEIEEYNKIKDNLKTVFACSNLENILSDNLEMLDKIMYGPFSRYNKVIVIGVNHNNFEKLREYMGTVKNYVEYCYNVGNYGKKYLYIIESDTPVYRPEKLLKNSILEKQRVMFIDYVQSN